MTAPDTTAGHTRLKWFFAVLIAGFLGLALMLTGLSQGALAASFSVSGVSYKASGDRLLADGVVQYGSVDQSASAAHPVLVNGFRTAQIDNFCQSFVVPGLPVVGDITVKLASPGKSGFTADNLVLGVENVNGDLTLRNVEIGRDAGTLDKGPNGLLGPGGSFGIQADQMEIVNLRQQAWSTTASTLRLNEVDIGATAGRNECF